MLIKFDNGMSISIKQEEYLYCTEGETCEVAVFYPDGSWYDLDGCGNSTSVRGHLNADALSELLVEIAALEVEA